MFGADHIGNERLSCNVEEIVVFTANIYSQYPENILEYIEQWLSSGNATIIINNDRFIMDHDCNPQIRLGFDAQFCTSVTASANTITLYISIGAGTALIVIMIIITTVLMAIVYKKKASMKRYERLSSQAIIKYFSLTDSSMKKMTLN